VALSVSRFTSFEFYGRMHLLFASQRAINRKIVARHSRGEKARFETPPHLRPVERRDARQVLERGVDRVDDEAGDPMIDHFGGGAVGPRKHRRAARHGFDHRKTEGFRPVDRKKKRGGITEKCRLFSLVHFSDELHVAADERDDAAAEVGCVGLVNLGSDAQLNVRAARDLDGPLEALLRRNAPEERVIGAARGRVERADLRYTVATQFVPGAGARWLFEIDTIGRSLNSRSSGARSGRSSRPCRVVTVLRARERNSGRCSSGSM
jgi:hypothetical protein